MKKTIFLSIICLLIVSVFAGSSFAEPQFKLRFSSVSVPGDAHTVAMTVFKEEIEKSTKGAIQVEVFHSGQLFTQEAQNIAIIRGNLDLAYTDPNWLAQYAPFWNMFTAGYIFNDYNHMTKVLNGPIGKKLYEDIARQVGIRPLCSYYLGTRQLNLRDIGRVVKTPDDLKGVKLRMPNAPSWLFLGKALGANPTPLSFTELYMALSAGTVDGQDNPLPTNKNAKFYEVTKYIILTDHYISPIMPTINEKKWKEIVKAGYQRKMMDAIEKAHQYCDQTNLKAESELVEFFKKQGLTVVVPDKKAFKERVLKAYLEDKEMSAVWDMDLYKKVQALGK